MISNILKSSQEIINVNLSRDSILLFFICLSISFTEYNESIGVLFAYFFFALIIISFIINRKIGSILFLLTISVFSDRSYLLEIPMWNIHTETILGRTIPVFLALFILGLILYDMFVKKIKISINYLTLIFIYLLIISILVSIIQGNIFYLGESINDLRFFFNYFVGYFLITIYLKELKVEDIFSFLFIPILANQFKLVLLAFTLSESMTIYKFLNDSSIYIVPIFLTYIFFKKDIRINSKLIYLILFLAFIIVSPTRGVLVSAAITFGLYIIFSDFKSSFFKIIGLSSILFIFIYFDIVKILAVNLVGIESYEFLLWKLETFDPNSSMNDSAGIRLVEFQNIIHKNLSSVINFIFGSGLGGYWTSEAYPYFFILFDATAYPDEWIINDMFFKPHGIIQFTLLKFGFVGTLIIWYYILKNLFSNKNLFNLILIIGLIILFLVAFSSKLQFFTGIFSGLMALNYINLSASSR